MLKRDGQASLHAHPPIRDHLHEVLRRHWLVKTHSEGESVLIVAGGLPQHELLRVQNGLIVAVVDHDPEWLSRPVILAVPSEQLVNF